MALEQEKQLFELSSQNEVLLVEQRKEENERSVQDARSIARLEESLRSAREEGEMLRQRVSELEHLQVWRGKGGEKSNH